jgi:thiol-disulfide isomerase/thioredoxin
VKPWKAVLLALLAAALGLLSALFVVGPGVLLRTDAGQWLFERTIPRKYENAGGELAIGQAIAAFEVRNFQGQPQRLPKPGQWQVINYWASWCGPCRLEMPWLDAAHARSQGRFEVIGIALEAPESAQTLLDEIPVRFTQFHEPPGAEDSSVRLGNAWGVLPFTVLISSDGRLVKRHIGSFKNAAALNEWIADGIR